MRSLWALPLFLIGCASLSPLRPVTPEESEAALRVYESIFPLYGEFCAHTQIRKKIDSGIPVVGNKYGHGGLYLKGACLDTSEGYPLLRLCNEHDEETGAGISTDYAYRSVSWVASPSRHFFYWGDLKPGERLTWPRDLKIQDEVVQQNMFVGITGSETALKGKPANLAEVPFLLDENFATDYAINLGRASACARVPLTREMLVRMIEFLNGLNRTAHASGNPFSGLGNNCVHTWHNALSAVDFWKPLHTNRCFPLVLFDLAVPFNQFSYLMERGNELPLEDPVALFDDDEARKMFDAWGRFPTGAGILMEFRETYPDNEVFDTTIAPHFLDWLGLAGTTRALEKYSHSPETTELVANLRAYRDRFAGIRRARANREDSELPSNSEFRDFLTRYDRWIDSQDDALDADLRALNR